MAYEKNSDEVQEAYMEAIKPSIDKLQGELLKRVEFFISKDDSRFHQWKGFIFTQCQDCGREIKDSLDSRYDLIRKKVILSVKF